MNEQKIYTDQIVCPFCGFLDTEPFEGNDFIPTSWVSHYCKACECEFDVYADITLVIHIRR